MAIDLDVHTALVRAGVPPYLAAGLAGDRELTDAEKVAGLIYGGMSPTLATPLVAGELDDTTELMAYVRMGLTGADAQLLVDAALGVIPIDYLLFDSFTRANEVLGAPEIGSAPVVVGGGTWNVIDNQLGLTAGANENSVQWDVGATAYEFSCTLKAKPSDGGPVVRANGSAWFLLLTQGANYILHSKNPTYSPAWATGTATPTVDDVIKIRVEAEGITVFINDVEDLSFFDGNFSEALNTNTKVGFRENFGTSGRFDDIAVVAYP